MEWPWTTRWVTCFQASDSVSGWVGGLFLSYPLHIVVAKSHEHLF